MPRIAYVNGQYVPHNEAAVHVEDRGYQFADGVYEVIAVTGGAIADVDLHLDRLDRSLAELHMPAPMSRPAMLHVLGEAVRRNHIQDGMVYLQITRGTAQRDHPFPENTPPSLVVTARHVDYGKYASKVADGIAIRTTANNRWARPDIKSVALLSNVLAKQDARQNGAYEAWFTTPDGHVLEGASTNAWIVTAEGTLVTHPADRHILGGITRAVLLQLAKDAGMTVEERRFTVDEAKAAKEAFVSSTVAGVVPVVRIDDNAVGNGAPGSQTLALAELYRAHLASFARDRDGTLARLQGAS